MPEFVDPMLATLVAAPFDDPDWLFEIKWDGFRVEAVVRAGEVRLWTRGQKDAEGYFGPFLDAANVDRRAGGDRRRRGDRVRTRWRARFRAAPGAHPAAQGRASGDRWARLPGLRSPLAGRALACRAAPRRAQGVPERRPAQGPAGPPVGPHRDPRYGVLRGRQDARPRGDHGQGAPQPLPPGYPVVRLAEGEDPARAGARRRRVEPGQRHRGRSGRAPRGHLRGRRAPLRGQDRRRVHGHEPRRAARRARAAHDRVLRHSSRPRHGGCSAARRGSSPRS